MDLMKARWNLQTIVLVIMGIIFIIGGILYPRYIFYFAIVGLILIVVGYLMNEYSKYSKTRKKQ